MSTQNVDKYGGLTNPSKTSVSELRITNPDAALDWDSTNYQVVGTMATFNPNNTANRADSRGGVPSVIQETHLAERDVMLTAGVREYSAISKQLLNMTDLPVTYTNSTQGFTSDVVGTGCTRTSLNITTAQASQLTVDNMIVITQLSGNTESFEEERIVKSVVGGTVVLRHPLSIAPASGDAVRRVTNFNVPEGGGSLKPRHVNIKTSADNNDLHIMNYPQCRSEGGTYNPGSASDLMAIELNFVALAQAETINSIEEPVFSREYLVPKGSTAGE